MQDNQNEKLSLLLDDQLDPQQALGLLKDIQDDPALMNQLRRYQAISQVIKSRQCLLADQRFAAGVAQRLQNEPAYLLPARRRLQGLSRKAGFALAASVMLVAVWLASRVDKAPQDFSPVGLVAFQAGQPESDNDRLKAYLQAHDQALYANTAPAFQPYARVVGYSKD